MINDIVNHIKARLGASHRKLELSDEDIVNCLQTETLQTLSVYHPFYMEYGFNFNTSAVDNMEGTYNLPTEIEGFKVLGVERSIGSVGQMSMNSSFNMLGGNLLSAMTSFMNSKLAAGLQSVMMPPETFQYIHPGMFRVYNTSGMNSCALALKTTHRKDFGTFPPGLRETIFKLALADVANDLLGIRTYFQNVGSTFAEINLNLDLLNKWSDSRDEIVEQMRKNQLKNAGVRKIYLA